jgi:integrase
MERFEEFLQERKYLLNVSPKTLVSYKCAFAAWQKRGGEPKQWVINMREAGISAISINTYICALNCYWKWAGSDWHLNYLKEEQKVLATLNGEQVRRLVAYKPKGKNQARAHIVACLILDCCLRISEALSLTRQRVDLDNLVAASQGQRLQRTAGAYIV